MFKSDDVQPIKTQVIPIGEIRNGAGTLEGSGIIRIASPARIIHWTLQVGWAVPTAATPSVSGTLSVYPLMKDPQYGSRLIRMQPVLLGATLPSGYEAESGIKDWEASFALSSDETNNGRIFAVVTWEPSTIPMCAAERDYWAGLCNAQLVTPLVSLGASV